MNIIEIDTWSKVPENYTGIVIRTSGRKSWHKEGLKHREDGPAVEHKDGRKFWYLEDQFYSKINLNDYIVLDYYKGKYDLMWYKLLDKDRIKEYPDIPGLIKK